MRALVLTLLASVALAQQTEMYNPLADRVRTEDRAFLILPPKRLPFEFVTEAYGDHGVLVVTASERPSIIYNAKIKVSDMDPLKSPAQKTVLYDLDSKRQFALPSGDSIEPVKVSILGRHKQSVFINWRDQNYIWNPTLNRMDPLASELEYEQFYYSDLSPFLILRQSGQVHAYNLDGNKVWSADVSHLNARSVSLSGIVDGSIQLVVFHPSGSERKYSYALMDPITGQVSDLYEEPRGTISWLHVQQEATASGSPWKYDFYATEGVTNSSEEGVERRLPHELPRRGAVAMEATKAEPHHRNSQTIAVWYIRDFELYVREVIEYPLAAYEEQFIADYKMHALIAGKNVALGMHMYATDYEDQFPPLGRMPDALAAYLKDRGDLEEMVFLLDGGSMSDMGDPAATVMGYRDTPYGRVLMFADGHVQWRDP